MADFSINDLTQPATRAEVQASIYLVLDRLGVKNTLWKPGSPLRTLIVGASTVLSALSDLQAKLARMGFLEFAEDDWLTLVARYVYGVERDPATFASGELTLTNSGGAVYALDPDDLIVGNATTGKTYRNTAPFTLGALSSLTIPIRASEAGSDSSAEPGEITELTTPLLGVVATNAARLIGTDAQSDPALRASCSEMLGSLSPFGPWDAYASAVRNAKRSDGSKLRITRSRLTKDGYGNVTLYVATAAGAVPGTVGDLDTDLGIADEAVQRNAAPQAVTASTVSASVLAINVTCEVWLYNTSGKTETEIAQAILERLRAFMELQPIGGNVIGSDPGKVFVDAVRTAIGSTLPEIFHVAVTAPAGDTTLAVNQVPTLGALLISALHQEAPPEGHSP